MALMRVGEMMGLDKRTNWLEVDLLKNPSLAVTETNRSSSPTGSSKLVAPKDNNWLELELLRNSATTDTSTSPSNRLAKVKPSGPTQFPSAPPAAPGLSMNQSEKVDMLLGFSA